MRRPAERRCAKRQAQGGGGRKERRAEASITPISQPFCPKEESRRETGQRQRFAEKRVVQDDGKQERTSAPCAEAKRTADSYATVNAVPYLQLDRWEDTTRAADDFSDAISGIGVSASNSNEDLYDILRNADNLTSATAGQGKAAAAANQEYKSLLSTVQGIVDESMKLDDFKASDLFSADELKAKGLSGNEGISASQALGGGMRQDAVNENARRLAAIAKEGFIGQDWLEEFKAEVPGVYADLMLKQAAGLDLRTAALQIMQEFQAGMRPELLDKGMIKERVKAMILGDQNASALAEEIAAELAAEMGIPIQEALAAAGGAMGVKTGAAGAAAAGAGGKPGSDMTTSGASAGQTFMAGFVANADGVLIVAGIVAKMAAEFPKFRDNGAHAGTQWGAGFMSTVESGIASPLITILATLVTPTVMANFAAAGTQTTPP